MPIPPLCPDCGRTEPLHACDRYEQLAFQLREASREWNEVDGRFDWLPLIGWLNRTNDGRFAEFYAERSR